MTEHARALWSILGEFPVNILTHKNSIRLLQIQPVLNIIKRRYAGDKEQLHEEQYNLFKKEKYSPYVGLVPLFIQLVVIIGVMQVMYNPLQHMLHFNKEVIEALVQATRELYGIQGGYGEQLRIIEAIRLPENLSVFQTAVAGFPDAEIILRDAASIDLRFLGLNLGATPSIINPTRVLLVPFLSGFTSLIFCLTQSALSPGALSQAKGTSCGLTIFTVAFSLYFALVTPVGVGIYWTTGNLLSIAVVLILKTLYNPTKLAGEALAQIKAARKMPEQLREERKRNKELRIREKQDAARFSNAKKRLVFYALTGGQYKYYIEIIEYILQHSNIQIHYLTNDPNDLLFQQTSSSRIIPYYASHKKTISLMLKLNAEMVVTTVPDLQNFHFKRSIVRTCIEYVYVFHGFTSIHMVMRPHALDHYDTVFCVGEHHAREVRRLEELYSTSKKQLVKVGYSMFDRLTTAYENRAEKHTESTQILIAPSWQKDNIMELYITCILNQLLGQNYRIIIRPHPQFTAYNRESIEKLQATYADYIYRKELLLELDFMESSSIYLSDLVITDWSNTAYEFSFCTKKPVVFINTPMKVLNPRYTELGIEPSEIFLRKKVGVSVDVADLDTLKDIVARVLEERDRYRESITRTVDEFMYCPMQSGKAGGKYIISRLS